jgi:hypothetical protein
MAHSVIDRSRERNYEQYLDHCKLDHIQSIGCVDKDNHEVIILMLRLPKEVDSSLCINYVIL